MAVSPANDKNIDAWQEELNLGLDAIALLEEANRLVRKMGSGTESSAYITEAITFTERLTSKAALKVGRLRRAQEGE